MIISDEVLGHFGWVSLLFIVSALDRPDSFTWADFAWRVYLQPLKVAPTRHVPSVLTIMPTVGML